MSELTLSEHPDPRAENALSCVDIPLTARTQDSMDSLYFSILEVDSYLRKLEAYVQLTQTQRLSFYISRYTQLLNCMIRDYQQIDDSKILSIRVDNGFGSHRDRCARYSQVDI